MDGSGRIPALRILILGAQPIPTMRLASSFARAAAHSLGEEKPSQEEVARGRESAVYNFPIRQYDFVCEAPDASLYTIYIPSFLDQLKYLIFQPGRIDQTVIVGEWRPEKEVRTLCRMLAIRGQPVPVYVANYGLGFEKLKERDFTELARRLLPIYREAGFNVELSDILDRVRATDLDAEETVVHPEKVPGTSRHVTSRRVRTNDADMGLLPVLLSDIARRYEYPDDGTFLMTIMEDARPSGSDIRCAGPVETALPRKDAYLQILSPGGAARSTSPAFDVRRANDAPPGEFELSAWYAVTVRGVQSAVWAGEVLCTPGAIQPVREFTAIVIPMETGQNRRLDNNERFSISARMSEREAYLSAGEIYASMPQDAAVPVREATFMVKDPWLLRAGDPVIIQQSGSEGQVFMAVGMVTQV